MAMAVCSSSNQYSQPFINTSLTPSYPKLSNNGNHLVFIPHSSSNYTCSTLQDEVLAISSHESLQHADILLAPAKVLDLNWYDDVSNRRKRRRKRRKMRLECVAYEKMEIKRGFMDKEGRSRFMTSKEDARFSGYLKERARIEAVRTKLMGDTGEEEIVSYQWAKASGISQRCLDKVLCNGRLSEEIFNSCYHRFVISIASSYQGKGLSLKDLTQEGSIGLLRGAVKFNPEKGYKLSTYAYWWIRQAITRAIANKSRIIRLPGSVIELMPKICEANTVLSRKLLRFPTYSEIAKALDIETSVVKLALERNRPPISLDKPITSQLSQGSMSIQDIIPGPDEITPEAMLMKDLIKPEIQSLLEPLCDREVHILRLHYGLSGETPQSFEEIGRSLNLSRERVRQINSSALSKLRQTRGINDLKYYI